MIFVFDGIDGCGKSTHAKHAFDYVVSRGYDAVLLKEPTTESPAGIALKEALESGKRPSPEEELRLFIEDRKWDVENRIIPALQKGEIVVLDRYYYSTVAYQGARGMDAEKIMEMNSFAPKPDIGFILDIEPEIAMERIKRRKNADYFEELEYLKKVREIFLSMKGLPEVVIIDSSGDKRDVEVQIKGFIDRVL